MVLYDNITENLKITCLCHDITGEGNPEALQDSLKLKHNIQEFGEIIKWSVTWNLSSL